MQHTILERLAHLSLVEVAAYTVDFLLSFALVRVHCLPCRENIGDDDGEDDHTHHHNEHTVDLLRDAVGLEHGAIAETRSDAEVETGEVLHGHGGVIDALALHPQLHLLSVKRLDNPQRTPHEVKDRGEADGDTKHFDDLAPEGSELQQPLERLLDPHRRKTRNLRRYGLVKTPPSHEVENVWIPQEGERRFLQLWNEHTKPHAGKTDEHPENEIALEVVPV
mmetsp:Transcript_38639/g.83697  ORF Transcript_38639/g.83697 Transcript_38639/m.83697 type:complete len:222 (-) Transcript_38639:375-1040(-)